MFRQLSICVALTVAATGTLNAQQQEAVLRKAEIPGTNFYAVVATPKFPAGVTLNLRDQPDPTIAYIAGGALALSIDSEVEKLFKNFGSLLEPNCNFLADDKSNKLIKPIAVYLVPTGETSVEPQRDAAAQIGTRTMSLTKMELLGAEFDIVFGLTRFPDTGKLVFRSDEEAGELFPTVVSKLIPSCVTHVARNDGTADVVAVYVVPKEERVGASIQ